MVSFSKLFDKGLRDATCQEVFHPGRTCSQFHFEKTFAYVITCMKYFAPIAGLPLIMKGRSIQKLHIRDALKYYLELVLTGFVISQSFPMSLCGTRMIFGRFSKHSIVYIPNMIATWSLLFTTDRVARLFTATMFQVTFETVLRNGRNPVSRTIGQSKGIQTLLFMICSAFVLHTLQKHAVKTFWMVKPISISDQGSFKKCAHTETCFKFCLKELAKKILIGIPFDMYKAFSGNTKGSSFGSTLKRMVLNLDFPTTLFLATYTAIYRSTSCLLNRTWEANHQFKHIVAAFLGGSSFYFLPRLTILTYGVSVCIETAWELFKRHELKQDNKIVEKVKQIQFHRVYILLPAGYLAHMYAFQPHLLNQMGLAIISTLTGNEAVNLRNDIHCYLKSLEK